MSSSASKRSRTMYSHVRRTRSARQTRVRSPYEYGATMFVPWDPPPTLRVPRRCNDQRSKHQEQVFCPHAHTRAYDRVLYLYVLPSEHAHHHHDTDEYGGGRQQQLGRVQAAAAHRKEAMAPIQSTRHDPSGTSQALRIYGRRCTLKEVMHVFC